MARSKLSESNRSECINLNRLWLDVGRMHSNFSECDSPAAINSAGPESSRRNGNWHQSVLPISLPASSVAEWNSVLVEPVRLILRRWRGVCSFSQTMRGTRSDEESHLVYDLRSKKRSRPACPRVILRACPTVVRRGDDLLRSYSKALNYDDISIT